MRRENVNRTIAKLCTTMVTFTCGTGDDTLYTKQVAELRARN